MSVPTPEFNPKAHNIISLEALINNQKDAIQALKQELTTRGWAILNIPLTFTPSKRSGFYVPFRSQDKPYVLGPGPNDTKVFQSFFSQSEEVKAKTEGYSSVPHKQSVHILTPAPSPDKLGSILTPTLTNWINSYDELAFDLVEHMAQPIFGCRPATLAHRADLPMAYGRNAGMLDVAYYLNQVAKPDSPEVGLSTEEVNCIPHYDPGLFSISFFSSHEGLQLQDPTTKTWFAGPVNTQPGQEDYGVIWLGKAAVTASKGTLREGIHRVVYPRTAVPRIAAWYEVCTVDQVNQELQELPTSGVVKLPNAPGSLPITLVPGNGRRQIERYTGMPMSKMPRRIDMFAAGYSEDLEKNKHRYKN